MKAIDRDSAVESVKNLYEFASEWAYERGMCDVVESLRCDRDEVEAVIDDERTWRVHGSAQASSMRLEYSSDQWSSVPSGSSTTRCGSSASAAPGSWVTSTTAPW